MGAQSWKKGKSPATFICYWVKGCSYFPFSSSSSSCFPLTIKREELPRGVLRPLGFMGMLDSFFIQKIIWRGSVAKSLIECICIYKMRHSGVQCAHFLKS